MRAPRVGLLLALGAGAAGCELTRAPTAVEPHAPAVVVHAVLAAGADEAAVLLTRVGPRAAFVPGRPAGFEDGADPLAGAEVSLASDAGTVRLEEDAEGLRSCFGGPPASLPGSRGSGPGCYAGRVPGGVRAGASYRLLVRLPGGTTIEGSASPPPPVALGPRPRDPVRVRWTPQGGFGTAGAVPLELAPPAVAAGVGLAIVPTVVFLDGAPAEGVRCTLEAPRPVIPAAEAARATLPVQRADCWSGSGGERRAVRPDSLRARLFVTAYDSAFMRYRPVLQRRSLRGDAAAQGVAGALGLFAAETTVHRDLTLLPVD